MPVRPLAPDLILLNAVVHTMNAHDLTAEAIAIKDGMIVGVGSNAEIRELEGFGTVIEDLGGGNVLPGLIDAHNHLLHTGQILGQIQLYDCRSIPEILTKVEQRTREIAAGGWILGRGWDESLLAEGRHPTRQEPDRVAPNHPVVLHRVWNKLVANSAAIQAAGIDHYTPDPPSSDDYAGSFERDEHGEPTGLFRDRAKDLITKFIPTPTPSELVDAIERACC